MTTLNTTDRIAKQTAFVKEIIRSGCKMTYLRADGTIGMISFNQENGRYYVDGSDSKLSTWKRISASEAEAIIAAMAERIVERAIAEEQAQAQAEAIHIKVAAEILGVGLDRLRKLCWEGKLSYVKPSHVTRAAVEALKAARDAKAKK